MALPDLTGINIENSYQRVVHTDGVNYYNGTGSLLNLGPINTGSFATTGSNTFIGSQTISGSGVQVPLQVVSGSTTLFHISSSNNIGFNQTASGTTHVQFKSPYSNNIVEINTNANGQYGVRTDNIIKARDFYFYNSTGTISSALGVTLLGFSALNNVGVATNSPQRRLHVDASGSASTDTPLALTSTDANQRVGILFASSSLASGRQHKLLHRVNGPVVEWLLNSNAGETAIWRFQPRDDTNYGLNILTPYNGGTTYVTTGLSQSLFSLGAGSQNAQHLNISSSGFVGIGTSAPAYSLDVLGNIQANGTRRILVDSANGSITIKGSAGGWANSFGFLGSANTTRGGFGAFGSADVLNYYYIGGTYLAPTMVLTSGSNLVGINTTTPLATLDVSGSVRITNNAVITGSLIVIEANGNPRLDTSNGVLYRAGIASVDWRTRTLNNSSDIVVLDWDTSQTLDTLGFTSIDWENRVLWDLTGGAESIDYGRRKLYNSAGDVTLDYNAGTFAGTAATASYVTPLNQNVQITGSLSVSGSVIINNVDIQSTIIAMAIALG